MMYKSLSDNLEENEIVFAITVEHVQMIAERMGREPLNYDEMDSVQNGVEWGLDFWSDIVRTAIKNLPSKHEDDELEEPESDEE
ncbi:MAG: hypothetical protein HYS25_06680 [Ignavibacteriales bacterium]|nr:hypothetical protein [Ignavibacteriales bacterium]